MSLDRICSNEGMCAMLRDKVLDDEEGDVKAGCKNPRKSQNKEKKPAKEKTWKLKGQEVPGHTPKPSSKLSAPNLINHNPSKKFPLPKVDRKANTLITDSEGYAKTLAQSEMQLGSKPVDTSPPTLNLKPCVNSLARQLHVANALAEGRRTMLLLCYKMWGLLWRFCERPRAISHGAWGRSLVKQIWNLW